MWGRTRAAIQGEGWRAEGEHRGGLLWLLSSLGLAARGPVGVSVRVNAHTAGFEALQHHSCTAFYPWVQQGLLCMGPDPGHDLGVAGSTPAIAPQYAVCYTQLKRCLSNGTTGAEPPWVLARPGDGAHAHALDRLPSLTPFWIHAFEICFIDLILSPLWHVQENLTNLALYAWLLLQSCHSRNM